jgi:hypothetical protein
MKNNNKNKLILSMLREPVDLVKIKEIYNFLLKFPHINSYSNEDKITKWKFYNEENDFLILIFDQSVCKISKYNIIYRKWYISKQSNNFRYELIYDISKFVNNNELNLIKMKDNIEKNNKIIKELTTILGNITHRNDQFICWNNDIRVTIDIYKSNDDKNININYLKENQKSKKEIIKDLTFKEILNIFKKLDLNQNVIKNTQIQNTNENINKNVTENINQNKSLIFIQPLIKKKEEKIYSRKELSEEYKHLFIKYPKKLN